MPIRLVYVVSHPIQYQAPLLRLIAADPDIRLNVLFEHTQTAETFYDPGFGRPVRWDIPLTAGYEHDTINNTENLKSHIQSSDIVWVHGWDSVIRRKALTIANSVGVPVLMRGENTQAAMPDGPGIKGLAKRWYLSRIFEKCDGFLCIGTDNRSYYESHGVEPTRLHFMPYTVDNEFFQREIERAAAKRETFRRELGIDSGSPVILYSGKLQRRKHPVTLLKAFLKLDHGALGDPFLLFVGDGEERPRLEAQAFSSSANMRLLGFRNQTELPAFYDLADIFVLPAERGPWGLAVNEAMNAGCVPIVSAECGCAADLIDETCGRIVTPGSEAALTSAIDDTLCDPVELASMSVAAREKISRWGFPESIGGIKKALNAVLR